MLVLGIESSCDETAAAIVEDGRRVVAEEVASQIAIHAGFGGVVPEIAARAHVVHVLPVIDAVLKRAAIGLSQVDAIAVTCGPGLIGALLVGVQTAKAIAFGCGLPLIGVNHLEGHLCAVFLDVEKVPSFPHLALLVSGGHSEIVVAHDFGKYELLGATRDDAAGEAFDKVGKLLGLGYPAGPLVDKLARTGDRAAVKLPQAMRGRGLDFSFSGIKTAVATHVQKHGVPTEQALSDLCASFQAQVVAQLVSKTMLALDEKKFGGLVVSGGVACNRGLRQALQTETERRGVDLFIPSPERCTDNAAMIACAGYYRLRRGERAPVDLKAAPGLSLTS